LLRALISWAIAPTNTKARNCSFFDINLIHRFQPIISPTRLDIACPTEQVFFCQFPSFSCRPRPERSGPNSFFASIFLPAFSLCISLM
jgi:hypothetical protein